MTKLRRVQVYKDNKWQDIEFEGIKSGNIFRLFEPDNSPVVDSELRAEFVAAEDAHETKMGWAITIVGV